MCDDEISGLKNPEISNISSLEWELDSVKHIFILSSSGKPIFSKHGNEQNLVTTYGLLQAVVSIVENAGDRISCIKAGDRRIVYFFRNHLYFISISSTDEPEAVLSSQLEFMYGQILFVLTTKVHDVLALNSAKDIRDLLGYDTTKLMYQSCSADITPFSIAFNAVNGFLCAKDLRNELTTHLKNCISSSGAVLGLLLYRDQLLSYSVNSSIDLELETSDILLLANFVGNSKSLRSTDQNWIPICLPAFNSNAYLQAYVCNINLVCGTKRMDFSLVLISQSADPLMFAALHEGRQELECALITKDIPERLMVSFSFSHCIFCSESSSFYLHVVFLMNFYLLS
jgi:hypothetical protein